MKLVNQALCDIIDSKDYMKTLDKLLKIPKGNFTPVDDITNLTGFETVSISWNTDERGCGHEYVVLLTIDEKMNSAMAIQKRRDFM